MIAFPFYGILKEAEKDFKEDEPKDAMEFFAGLMLKQRLESRPYSNPEWNIKIHRNDDGSIHFYRVVYYDYYIVIYFLSKGRYKINLNEGYLESPYKDYYGAIRRNYKHHIRAWRAPYKHQRFTDLFERIKAIL